MGPLRRLRKSGCWFFYLDQRRVFTPYRNKADAEACRYRHLAETAERTKAAGMEGCTVGDLLQIVEDDYASHNKRSIASLRSRLKRLRAEFKDVRAADLDEATIAEYRDKLELSPASVNRDLEVLRRALRLGVREKLIAQAPYVEMLRVENARSRRNTEDETSASNERLREIGRQVEGYLGRLEPRDEGCQE